MPHKPIRQVAAEKARGNKPANPSQLGDPIDLKAETSDGPDPVETEMPGQATKADAVRSAHEGNKDRSKL
ncbi:hypothetical protein BT67DRAFT_437749 [Trichocladium antarcticum]|uniref:Uncharacterized protein n=1 Tax=Trichocladium antarcticum TaxID=1450529 RepID=A0AAN6USJ6_9PEZI|nr:hypothetical protein BT67DRAFT_437749 [Trichocladium antarcticum]